MKRHSLVSLFIFYMTAGFLTAQSTAVPGSGIAGAWQEAGEAIVLLRNENELLPLKQIHGSRVWLHHFGANGQKTFEETVFRYVQDRRRPKLLMKNDLVISTVDAAALAGASPAEINEYENWLKGFDNHNRIVIVFGNSQDFASLPLPALTEALIWAPDSSENSQSIAAQVIFGACGAAGKLPSDIGQWFRKGEGLRIAGNARLGYAPPETAGLDSRLLRDSIAAIVEEGIRKSAYPGAQVLVAKDGKIVFHQTYGYHTYDSLQPVSHADIYDFASVTKVTSTLPALMKLYGEGRFDLDAPLRHYLPYFKKSEVGNVSCRELLAHYGRLQPSIVFWREARQEDGQWKKRSFRTEYSRRYSVRITDSLFLFKKYRKQIYKGIRELPLMEKKEYVYSDLSFILYPAIVEKLSGRPLEEYLRETFYHPLGAWTLTYNPLLRNFPLQQLVPTERDTFFRKMQVQGTVHDETAAMLGGVSGHAGLFGSAVDLARLVQMYLNGGEYGGVRYIAREAVETFTRCQYCSEGNRRGLGFDKPPVAYDPEESYVARDASASSFGHSGYTGTFFWADPEYNLQVIFFSNRVYPDRSSVGLYDLNIRSRVQQAVYDAMLR